MMRRPPPPAPRRQAPPPAQRCVEINQCVGCTRQFFMEKRLIAFASGVTRRATSRFLSRVEIVNKNLLSRRAWLLL